MVYNKIVDMSKSKEYGAQLYDAAVLLEYRSRAENSQRHARRCCKTNTHIWAKCDWGEDA